MLDTIKITDSVKWLGSNDRTTHLFESLWPIPEGVCYNTYLVSGAQKTALIDTLKAQNISEYITKLKTTLADRKLDYLIINHMEPDHSGAIPIVQELYPEVTIVGNKTTFDMLANFYNVTQNLMMVKDGDTLDLGERTLKFYLTPMLHWPETMMSYLVEEKLLFSGDAFGGFGALDGGIFDDEVSTCYVDNEIMRYFTNIVGKYGAMVQAALKKLAALEVKTICSTHGPIWRSKPEHIIAKYDQWSKQEAERGVVIVFCSMYGNTEQLADRVARKLVAVGEENVQVINAATTHVSYIINEIWKYNAIVLAAPTYNLSIFPTMKFILEYMIDYGVKDKITGLLSSYTWSGGAMKKMKDAVEKLKWELAEPVIEVKSAAKEADFFACDRLAIAIHNKLEKIPVNKPGCNDENN